ncbi:Hypothetical_protein [Hexamita inflata]|uniref:Hypothetical_protein n=1 Tax=Hexamita inflata TaxID=28002 RepID=A0AA86UT14_9EUKA|nr:Hypothetical protein HINF_LOCUS54494 [Hexamita inflata]
MQYVKNQTIINMCKENSKPFDKVVIYLDSQNKKVNKLQTYNLKVLYILTLQDMKIQSKIPVDNGMIYTVKGIQQELQDDDFVKCVISNEQQEFKLVTGEYKQFYPCQQFRVTDREIQVLKLYNIQNEFTKVNVEFEILDM